MIQKIKDYWTYILEGLVALLTLAFLFEKSKKETDDAQIAEQKTQEEVATLQKQVTNNDAQLQVEEQKRAEIKKAGEDAKSDDSDSTSFLNKR